MQQQETIEMREMIEHMKEAEVKFLTAAVYIRALYDENEPKLRHVLNQAIEVQWPSEGMQDELNRMGMRIESLDNVLNAFEVKGGDL